MTQRHLLLVSDIDDTIAGDPASLEAFRAWLGPGDGGTYTPTTGGRVTLAYASGRSMASIASSIAGGLPWPVAVLGSVGTDARTWPERAVVRGWGEVLARRPFDRDALTDVLRQQPDVTLQPAEEQGPHKVSATLVDATDDRLAALQAELATTDSDIQLVYSSRRDLDVLPAGVDKGRAAVHLADRLGFGRQRLVVAGDSGNDRSLFAVARYGIVVANARDGLGDHLAPACCHHATLPRAAGVQQGLQRWLTSDL